MTIIATDAFTDASNVALTSHDAHWLIPTGHSGLRICNNLICAMGTVGGGGASANYWNATFADAHYAIAKLHASQDCVVGCAIRVQSGARSYFYACYDNTDTKIYSGQVIANVATDWDAGQAGWSKAAGDTIELHLDYTTPTTVYLKKNGATIATYTGKSALSTGYAGVAAFGGLNVGIDSWEGGNVDSPTPAPTLYTVRSNVRLGS